MTPGCGLHRVIMFFYNKLEAVGGKNESKLRKKVRSSNAYINVPTKCL